MYYPNGKEMDQWYAMTSHVIAYRSKKLLFGTHAINFNCFLDDFNCVFMQIGCLSVLLYLMILLEYKIQKNSKSGSLSLTPI